MRHVIFASDSAYHPVGKARTLSIVKNRRAQHANPYCIKLGKPYRSDACSDISFDDARWIRSILERSYVHRHVRPARPCESLHQRRESRTPLTQQNVATLKTL